MPGDDRGDGEEGQGHGRPVPRCAIHAQVRALAQSPGEPRLIVPQPHSAGVQGYLAADAVGAAQGCRALLVGEAVFGVRVPLLIVVLAFADMAQVLEVGTICDVIIVGNMPDVVGERIYWAAIQLRAKICCMGSVRTY